MSEQRDAGERSPSSNENKSWTTAGHRHHSFLPPQFLQSPPLLQYMLDPQLKGLGWGGLQAGTLISTFTPG
uniref:Uncharacterized protein n=1 Tax=Knipowitschia caucasica TaxID=637954 RepID=A0AAV2KEI5_KNICA